MVHSKRLIYRKSKSIIISRIILIAKLQFGTRDQSNYLSLFIYICICMQLKFNYFHDPRPRNSKSSLLRMIAKIRSRSKTGYHYPKFVFISYKRERGVFKTQAKVNCSNSLALRYANRIRWTRTNPRAVMVSRCDCGVHQWSISAVWLIQVGKPITPTSFCESRSRPIERGERMYIDLFVRLVYECL